MPSTSPFYVIAHHVLTSAGIKAALSHGANAIEIDFTAYRSGWYASHSGLLFTVGDSAKDIFSTIVAEKKNGRNICFVWFDIKNPDWADPDDEKWKHASIVALQALAREILQTAGISCMYGFYDSTREGKAYKFLTDELNDKESISLDGKVGDQIWFSMQHGPRQIEKRIFCHGLFAIQLWFEGTLQQLRSAKESEEFGKVFAWTVAKGQRNKIVRLLDEAKVDGIVCGFQMTRYYDHGNTRQVVRDVIEEIEKREKRYHIATERDKPW